MPAKKDPPLTDEERTRRLRELADAAGTSDDPAAFDRAFDKLMKAQVSDPKGTAPKPEDD